MKQTDGPWARSGSPLEPRHLAAQVPNVGGERFDRGTLRKRFDERECVLEDGEVNRFFFGFEIEHVSEFRIGGESWPRKIAAPDDQAARALRSEQVELWMEPPLGFYRREQVT